MQAVADHLDLGFISSVGHLLLFMVKDALGMGPSEDPFDAVTHKFWHPPQKCQFIWDTHLL